MEAPRDEWLDAADPQEQATLAGKMQEQAFPDGPYYLIGQYKQSAPFRSDLEGHSKWTTVFWNLKRI